MLLKKIFVPVMVLSLAVFMGSCDSDKNGKNDAISTTAILPAGEISLAKLPIGVKDFIDKNYAGYIIQKAASDPLCQGGDAIDVAVTKSGEPNLSLIFKPDGSFVQQEEDVAMKAAPVKVRNAITAKYAGYSAGDQIEKLQLADKTLQYLVDLSKGGVIKEVIFSKDGAMVCEH
jgi:hypothetical protein